jgi:glutamate synthase (ferredoxin)
MTGGRVVVLGETGRNFAAGMSGGIAYVVDENGTFEKRYNHEMVDLETLTEPEEIAEVKIMIQRHAAFTGSDRAKAILEQWSRYLPKIVKVIPRDYRQVLSALKDLRDSGLNGDEAFMAAFEKNKGDLKRVSGN